LLNINDLQTEFIHRLSTLFQENKGDNTVAFEIMELEKIKRIVETAADFEENDEVVFVEENDDSDAPILVSPEISSTTEIEEINVVTKLSMPSRKLKVKISNELLVELEKMQINFKLN
jgi:DNA polymerase-3 subunit alpha